MSATTSAIWVKPRSAGIHPPCQAGRACVQPFCDAIQLSILASRISIGKAPVVSTWSWKARMSNRSEEHTSELQSLMRISYAVFCLKKKKIQHTTYQQEHN